MIKIAITGNIASGKSQVEEIISAMGFPVYDTDKIAHDVLNKITDFYGYDVFSEGKIDRKKLGKLVFDNKKLRKKLEDIVHPQVKDRITDLFKKHEKDSVVFVSVPLLYEAAFDKLFDKVLLIFTEKEIQCERLMNRNNYTREDALKRINSQISAEEKLKWANYVIENNSSLEDLRENVETFIRKELDNYFVNY